MSYVVVLKCDAPGCRAQLSGAADAEMVPTAVLRQSEMLGWDRRFVEPGKSIDLCSIHSGIDLELAT